jgi:hypothetical protein
VLSWWPKGCKHFRAISSATALGFVAGHCEMTPEFLADSPSEAYYLLLSYCSLKASLCPVYKLPASFVVLLYTYVAF